MSSLDQTLDMWYEQENQCGLTDLNAVWWRVPLYLLCSASVLGQYRFPVRHYWRSLLVQLAAYETQYQVQWYVLHTRTEGMGHGCVDKSLHAPLGLQPGSCHFRLLQQKQT